MILADSSSTFFPNDLSLGFRNLHYNSIFNFWGEENGPTRRRSAQKCVSLVDLYRYKI